MAARTFRDKGASAKNSFVLANRIGLVANHLKPELAAAAELVGRPDVDMSSYRSPKDGRIRTLVVGV